MNRIPQTIAVLCIAALVAAKLTDYLDLSWFLVVLLSALILVAAELWFWIRFFIAISSVTGEWK